VQPSPTPVQTEPGASAAGEKATEADAFVDTIGVNTHFDYHGTPYVTEWPVISQALIKSGIRHIRDGSPSYYEYGSRLATLGAAGIHHGVGFDVTATAETMAQTLASQAPYIDFVEPNNEYDSYASKDPNWVSHLVDELKRLYSTVRANPSYNGIVVLGPALRSQYLYPKLGNLTPIADDGNLHNATCNQNPGTSTDIGIKANIALVHASTTKPVWTTETGYSDAMSRSCGLPDDIIAKYDPRMIAQRFIAGEPRTYFYQFADMPSDPEFGATGLLYSSGQPKPQYTSLSNMIALLSDPGPSFETSRLQYAISGNTTNVEHILLQKRDGTYVILLWLEVPSWKSVNAANVGGERLAISPQSVTLTFASKPSRASLYQYGPNQNLISQTQTSNTSAITINVTDSISFLEIH